MPGFRPVGDGYLKGDHLQMERKLIGILIAVLLAALVYFLSGALGLPSIVGIIAAILVLLGGIPSGGYGLGSRFGGGRQV